MRGLWNRGRSGVLIGVSCRHPRRIDAMLIRFALRAHGARVVDLRPDSNIPWNDLQGLVIGGGNHLHPRHFDQEPEVEARYHHARDQLELELLRQSRVRHLPVLGICRGAQAINVSRDGTLCQDITPYRKLTRARTLLLPLQPTRLQSRSRLARILETTFLGVNRIHSQAIQKVGHGLSAVAWDADNFIQAIETTDRLWQVGVQWHPEYLLYHQAHRRLFAALVRAAERRRDHHHRFRNME
ncbi:gamma-glutamyl-gamma-aminobutyrate hydrolase family protein [Marinobacteraceae bacterium S3BR75-40.1]